MRKIELNEMEYELVENYKDAFDMAEVSELFTDYFEDYDYVLGDYAYDKLRLKGFYDSKNKKVTPINDYKSVKEYIEKYCAFQCKYFIIRKKR